MLTLSMVKRIVACAEDKAAGIPCPVSITVVDGGANVVYAERMDEALLGSVEASRKKARAAVLYKRPTKAFEEAIAAGRTAILTLPEVMAIEGGIPLIAGGKLLGGIGISGGTAAQDGVVATAAVEYFALLIANA